MNFQDLVDKNNHDDCSDDMQQDLSENYSQMQIMQVWDNPQICYKGELWHQIEWPKPPRSKGQDEKIQCTGKANYDH